MKEGRFMSFRHLMMLCWAMVLVIFITAPGCGGGTDGSGLSTSLQGQIVSSGDASPIGGVTVTDLQTGNSAVSDSQGNFVIETTISASSVTLMFENNAGLSTTAVIQNVSNDAESVTLKVTANPRTNSVQARVESVTPRGSPEPEATATSVPGGNPTPVPTVENPTPGPVPTSSEPTETPEPRPTRTPTPTPTFNIFSYTCDQLDLDGSHGLNANDFQHFLNEPFDFNRDGVVNSRDYDDYATVVNPRTGEAC